MYNLKTETDGMKRGRGPNGVTASKNTTDLQNLYFLSSALSVCSKFCNVKNYRLVDKLHFAVFENVLHILLKSSSWAL